MKDVTLGKFTRITLPELCKIVTMFNSATSCIEPFKRMFDSVSSHGLNIRNAFLQTGCFPDAFKTAIVKPLLKKHNLDSSVLDNYGPVSNLPFIHKIL